MILSITNAAGLRFTVSCLRKGDRFGLGGQLVYQGAPLVDFYDPSPGEHASSPLGRCVASYFANELLLLGDESGLQLNGRKPWWRLDPFSLWRLRRWVRAGCPEGADLD